MQNRQNDYGRDLDLLQESSCLCAWRMLSPVGPEFTIFSLFFIYWEMWPLYYSKANHSLPTLPHMFVIPFLLINIPHSQQLIIVSFQGNDWHTCRKMSSRAMKHKTSSTNHKCIYWTKESLPKDGILYKSMHTIFRKMWNCTNWEQINSFKGWEVGAGLT